MNIRGVVFDYGNVLSMPALPEEHSALVRVSGLDSETLDSYYWKYRQAYDAGEFVGRTYWEQIAKDARISLSRRQIEELIHHDVLMWLGVNQTMVDWAQQVHQAGMRTGILSNIVPELVDVMEKQLEWIHDFDHNVWSCRIGITKPNPAIFKLHPEAFGLPPSELLYIDDREENVEAARRAGYTGIVFRDIRQFRGELDAVGIASVLPSLPDAVLTPSQDAAS